MPGTCFDAFPLSPLVAGGGQVVPGFGVDTRSASPFIQAMCMLLVGTNGPFITDQSG